MTRQTDEALAAALRENLKRRKEQARNAAPQPSFGADEEGDVPPDETGGEASGAWVREGSKRS